MAMEITRPEVNTDAAPPLKLRVKAGALTDERVQRLRELLAENVGDSPVLLTLIGPERKPISASATSSAATPATASSPSCASSSAPTASAERQRSRLAARRSASDP
jgi:hypothetical protein